MKIVIETSKKIEYETLSRAFEYIEDELWRKPGVKPKRKSHTFTKDKIKFTIDYEHPQ